MPVMTLLLALPGLAALCLAMDRHHRDAFGRPPGNRRRLALRSAGTGLTALSFAAAVAGWGWIHGPIAWTVTLTGAALSVLGLATYAPRGIAVALLTLPPLAAAFALMQG